MEEHLDETLEITLESVKQKALRGIFILTGRTLILRLFSFIAQGFLWAFLEPEHFGTFILVSAFVNFLSYFADIGLGAALIQKKEKPKEIDFKTVFTVQEFLVLTISFLIVFISPFFTKTHSLTYEGRLLLYALTFSFFLASLKNIPSIMLERKLEFEKFIIPQILEELFYYISVVFFAWRGFGITSFTYSVIIRGLVGVFSIYLLQPWKPGIALSRESLKNLLSFGVPYQINSLLATIKDDGLTVVLGGILGSSNLGILGTAQKLSQYPLRFFMDSVTKVSFPAFSRMQNQKRELGKMLTRSTFFICSLTFPSLIGLVVMFPVIIKVIPKYQKWEPAFLPLIFFALNSIISSFTTQFTNLLNAIGKIKTTFKLMLMWTSLSWIFIPIFSFISGTLGASFAYFLVSVSSIIVIFIINRLVSSFAFFSSVFKPLLSSIIMGFLLLFLINNISFPNLFTFFSLVFLGAVIYFFSLYIFTGPTLLRDVKKVFKIIFRG